MREDPLKEQLMSYARDGAEEAFQPAAEEIHRRARRRYRRMAALTVTGALLAAGVGIGFGLYGHGITPTVNQPPPPATSPGPAVTSTTATTRPPVTSTTRVAAGVSGKVPGTFVAAIGDRVAVISTATGRIVRTIWGPGPAGTQVDAVGLSPDRRTVYFRAGGTDPCGQPGIFRVAADGGSATRIVADEWAEGLITMSADGSRLAYLAYPCPSAGDADVVLRDAGGALLHRWSTTSSGVEAMLGGISLSADGRQLAGPVFDKVSGFPLGVRVLDATKGASITDGRLLRAPDPGCALVNASFHPRTGQLAAFERCLPKDLQSSTPPRFRLLYLDAASGRLLSRSLWFDDHSGADLQVLTMDFDRTGRYLLFAVGSHDPMDSQEPRPETGTWWYRGGRRARVHDDQRIGSGSTSQLITSAHPSW